MRITYGEYEDRVVARLNYLEARLSEAEQHFEKLQVEVAEEHVLLAEAKRDVARVGRAGDAVGRKPHRPPLNYEGRWNL